MSILKQYNIATGEWDPILIGKEGSQGVQGIQGAVAVGGFYLFEQPTPQTVWEIVHNLGTRYPIVEVIGSDNKSLTGTANFPQIEFYSESTTILTFNTPTSGYAALTSGGGVQGVQGAQGLQGIQGSQGIQGIQGIAGYQGVQGIQGTGIKWRGIWDTNTLYEINDAVYYNGGSWIATQVSQNQDPPYEGSPFWDPIALQGIQGNFGYQGVQGSQGTFGRDGQQGVQGIQGVQGSQGRQGVQGIGFIWKGIWSDQTEYAINDTVFYNGQAWVSIQNTNLGNEPTYDSAYWQVMASQGIQGIQGVQGV